MLGKYRFEHIFLHLSMLHSVRLLFLSFTLSLMGTLSGQQVPEVIRFDNEIYRGAHQNWDFAQSCDGLIFVANTDGVLIYNGYSWRQVKILDGKRPRSLYTGKDCRVYVGGFEFFGYLSVEDPAKPVYKDLDVEGLKGSREEVWHIFGEGQQIIFQSFSEIYLFDYQKFERIKPQSNIMLGAYAHGQMLIPKIDKGIYLLSDRILTDLSWMEQLSESVKITGLLDYKGGVLITTQNHGVYLKANDKELEPVKFELSGELETHEINKAIKLKEGGFAIGTISNGVYILDEDLRVRYALNKQNSLTNNTVLALFEDRDGSIWVGLDKGINQIRKDQNHLLYYDKTGSLGTVFSAVLDEGKLTLGTNQGLFRENHKGEFELVSGTQGQVWSLLQVDGSLLAGHNSGTYVMAGNRQKFLGDQAGGWDMSKLPDGRVLQSTYGGFVILSEEAGSWRLSSRVKGRQLPMERFVLSGEKALGYHIDYGLILTRFTPDFDSIAYIRQFQSLGGESIDNQVILYENNGVAKVLSNAVGFWLDGDSLVPSLKKESLVDQYFEGVGLSIKGNFAPHNAFKNLQDSFAVIRVNDDGFELWKEGFKPEECAVSLDYILVNGKYHPLKQGENALDADENNLVFNLRKPFEGCHTLMYKLDSWDKDWIDVPSNGELHYRNLSGGDYRLLVRRGNTLEEEELISISVAPHWYQGWLGILIVCVVLFSSFYWFNLWHKRNLEKATNKLIKEKEQSLERERILAANEKMAHELSYKSKLLANSTMTLVQKNNMLNDLKDVLAHEEASETGRKKWKQKMRHLIEQNISSDTEWQIFEQNFAEVHEDFLERLKSLHPHLTGGEQRLAAYIRMNLSSKEIAPLMNISLRSVENKRYRLRKRLDLEHDDNLSSYLINL